MALDTTYRTDLEESMDDFSMDNDGLVTALDDIARINQLLGGNAVTLDGIKKLIENIPSNETITIMDFGCGGGDMLRMLSKYGTQNNLKFNLIGIDANEATIRHAEKCSTEFDNFTYLAEDIFLYDFSKYSIDIALITLTLHHFKDDEILKILRTILSLVKKGIVVNDLQRSKLAYRLFQAIIFVFRLEKMTANDGLISILRGFKRVDLEKFSSQLSLKKHSIKWKWAFRYQWIIEKL
ncbi:methyltransferase domain-containing protein [Kaistella antarctica]|uniref:Methyltransferase n=1 Tax=Kaistella antarctica TaxID=266748 RepID=A0A3S4ULK6_9FLAO|nr:methyltransferase domain-containing protein [Kaistella antarctica]KEY19283.1 methyltransferase [Kaistella antarctica]SEW05006.1 Methyltransferase domain-containing protein [Kaistella antarctica]VEH98546.1 Trans-aconitate methyltransferase [Kaistella antarctica]